MTLSIQSIVNLTTQINNQLDNPEKSFRQEFKECSVETKVDKRYLDTYINGVLVSEDYTNEVDNNCIGCIIEDIEAHLNNKLNRTKHLM